MEGVNTARIEKKLIFELKVNRKRRYSFILLHANFNLLELPLTYRTSEKHKKDIRRVLSRVRRRYKQFGDGVFLLIHSKSDKKIEIKGD